VFGREGRWRVVEMCPLTSFPFSFRAFFSELFLSFLVPTAISQAGKKRLSLNFVACLGTADLK